MKKLDGGEYHYLLTHMKLFELLLNKLSRKLLNIALSIIKLHVKKQSDLYLYTYKRKNDELLPITWKARGITSSSIKTVTATSDWNWTEIRDITDYSKKIVIDVGASLGATAVPLSMLASTVYALEPQSDNYNFLLDQIKIRRITNIKPYNVAASDYNGIARFYHRESHGIHSLGIHNKGKILSYSQVNVIKLDDFWKKEINEQIGLLKIDVEGFETEVLTGAKYLLENKLIDSIIFEFSPRIHKLRKIDIDAPIKILLHHNYNLFTVDGQPFTLDKHNLPKICDLIALPTTKG